MVLGRVVRKSRVVRDRVGLVLVLRIRSTEVVTEWV